MKEQLQQIQAVAVVTFLCILISVNSTGDYGKWFVVDGARETVDPETGKAYAFSEETRLVTCDDMRKHGGRLRCAAGDDSCDKWCSEAFSNFNRWEAYPNSYDQFLKVNKLLQNTELAKDKKKELDTFSNLYVFGFSILTIYILSKLLKQ